MRRGIIALSVTLAIALLASSVVYLPGTSADDTDCRDGMEYGATRDFDTQRIDDAIKYATGRSVEEWIDYLSDQTEYYDFSLYDDSGAISKFALTRNTYLDGDDYTLDDHLSAYLKVLVDAQAYGQFPKAGTYKAKEGQDLAQFLHDIFINHRSDRSKEVVFNLNIEVYLDVSLVTHVDLSTGMITDSYLTFKTAIYDTEAI